MKKLLFIGIVALMVQSLGAVTLPSSSYSPYAGGSSYGTDGSDGVVFSVGSKVSGSFTPLGAADNACTSETTLDKCTDCCVAEFFNCCPGGTCDDEVYEECKTQQLNCANECGRSLPLDGGLLILLVLSLAGGAAKLLRNRDKE